MIHNYVNRSGADSHGSWSVSKGGTVTAVLVQLTCGMEQTRIGLSFEEAMEMAAGLTKVAEAAMRGITCQMGHGDDPWTASTGTSTAPGITDEVLVELHDMEGRNGDRRTRLALPISDALNMVEDLARRSLQVGRDMRADAMSRVGRSPA